MSQGKRKELLERYLYEKIKAEFANQELHPESQDNYVTTTKDHFNVPGFDPEARPEPAFKYTLYTDQYVSYWSENKRRIHGVTTSHNPNRNFNCSARFSKPISERLDSNSDAQEHV